LNSFPVPVEGESIVKVVELRGSNICEVEFPEGEKMLVQIPTKFRKLVWIKRGNYLIISRPAAWDNLSYKVRAVVHHILFPDQVKHLKDQNLWPTQFNIPEIPLPVTQPKEPKAKKQMEDEEEEEEEQLDDYFVNSNHRLVGGESESEEEEEEEQELEK